MRLLGFYAATKRKIKNRYTTFFEVCYAAANKNYLTNVYGLGRSVLALCTLLTLVFNDIDYLFAEHLFEIAETAMLPDKINLFFLVGFEHLIIGKIGAIIILLAVISGYYPRITGVLHWWVCMSFYNAASILDGGDQIATVISLLLIPLTLLDNRKNHWNKAKARSIYVNFMAFICFVVIELQVALIYFQAGVEKPYKVDEWLNGTALYYWFNNNQFGAPDWLLTVLNPVLDSPFIMSGMNWMVIFFELLLFGAIFMQRKRRTRLLKYAIMFHFFIILLHGLVSFFFSIAAALILYLLPKSGDLKSIFAQKSVAETPTLTPASKVDNTAENEAA